MLRRRASGGLLDVLVLEDLLVERVEDDLLPVAADPLAYALPQPTERFEGGGRVFGEDHRSGLPRARFGANPPLADLRTDAWMHCAPEVQVKLDLSRFLLHVRGIRTADFYGVGIGRMAGEARALEVVAQLLDQRRVAQANQHRAAGSRFPHRPLA